MEEIVKQLLQTNKELTDTIVELSRELAEAKKPLPVPDDVPMEQLYLTEEEEDEEFFRSRDPFYGVNKEEVAELLELTGFDNTNVELA